MHHKLFAIPLLATTLLLSATTGFGQSANDNIIKGIEPADLLKTMKFTAPGPITYEKEWTPIKESDVLWKKRVWRTIDLNDKDNLMLKEVAISDLLIKGAESKTYKVYSANDDRFTTELSADDVRSMITPADGKEAVVDVKRIHSVMIKEDWICRKSDNKVMVRIIGIAPAVTVTSMNGSVTEQPAFWLYYPYIRPYLQQLTIQVNEPIHTVDELLEVRHFTGKITKISHKLL